MCSLSTSKRQTFLDLLTPFFAKSRNASLLASKAFENTSIHKFLINHVIEFSAASHILDEHLQKSPAMFRIWTNLKTQNCSRVCSFLNFLFYNYMFQDCIHDSSWRWISITFFWIRSVVVLKMVFFIQFNDRPKRFYHYISANRHNTNFLLNLTEQNLTQIVLSRSRERDSSIKTFIFPSSKLMKSIGRFLTMSTTCKGNNLGTRDFGSHDHSNYRKNWTTLEDCLRVLTSLQ